MKGDKKNIISERRKPKTPQKENMSGVDGRDTFQTPNYATDLLVPYIKEVYPNKIWECAAGLRKIYHRLEYHGFDISASDIQDALSVNFLSDISPFEFDCIITNPPFSLKRKFYLKCLEYKVPFALLIPADYSGWIIKACKDDGAEKIIPNRRIDYITPNTLKRIWEGETWKYILDADLDDGHTKLHEFASTHQWTWSNALECNLRFRFDSVYDAPQELLRKYSSSYFHSMWLTWGFNLGRTETFVSLSNEDKNNI